MSSIPVTVSNTDKLLLFQRPTQTSSIPLVLSSKVSSQTNNKKHKLNPRDVPPRPAIMTSNIDVSSGHDQTCENKGLRYDTYEDELHFRNMTLPYWVIGPRRVLTNNVASSSRVWTFDFPDF
jgi:hypothetical protein